MTSELLESQPRTAMTTAVVGDDAAAYAWARALRGCDGSDVRTLQSSDDLFGDLADSELDAVCFASPMRDLGAMVKRAIIARKHVLVATGIADSHQLILLDELARNRECVLLFDACGLADEALDTVRATVRDEHPIRRPRYIRAHRSVPGATALEGSALDAISRVLTLTGGLPAYVGALAPRFDDEDEDPSLVGITLRFESGLVARLDVVSMEPEAGDTITIMCEGRTTVVDSDSAVAPVRVLSATRRGDAERTGGPPSLKSEQLAIAPGSREERVASAFVEAVRSHQPLCNARELASAALVWETAMASLALGGEMIALSATHPLIAISRPQLQVIRGGGNTVESASVPRLRLVQGGRRSESVAPPPRSA